MNPDLLFHLRSLSRFIWYQTDEEDRFLNELGTTLKEHIKRTFVFNAALGLVPLEQLQKDWKSRAHQANRETGDIHRACEQIYKDDPRENQHFYVITDPHRWMNDEHVQRRFLNIIHQLHNDIRTIKIVIFVGPRLVIPQVLSRYIEVVRDTGLTDDQINTLVGDTCQMLQITTPKDAPRMFKGLTSYEVEAAVAQSIIKTKKDPDESKRKRIDPRFVAEFKRRQIHKTDLLQVVDVSNKTFDNVGGNDRFKAWAHKTKACWTEEGQKFGLKPPKGVLAVGVWGCGKSLSVQAMGAAWKLPVVSLEMGKLRSSAVGASEANVYRAIRLIESVAPCVVWVDEAEKSLSGGHSSSQSDAGTTSRTLGILSTWLQETKAHVCLAMTANSLKTLPVEFVNRMDERFFFDLPNEDERIDILKIHLGGKGQDPTSYDLADLSEYAKNMVGREIEQGINAALVDSFDAGKDGLDEGILGTVLKSKPRIFKTMVDELRELLDWVGYDEECDEGIRARFASDKRGESFKMIQGGEG